MIEFFARRRVPLGFACALIVLWFAQPTAVTLAIGLAVALLGEALRIWAAGHLTKSREVTSSGPYRWCAHPLYAGSSIMGIGLAMAANRLIVAATIVLYLSITLTAAIRSEEAFLSRTFGPDYDRYRRGSPDETRGAAARRFSMAQARANREHRALAGLAAAVLLLFLKATYNGAFWRAAAGQ